MHAGNNVESLGIRAEIQVDRAPVPAQSVDYAVTDKNEDDHVAAQAHPSLKATSEEGMIVREEALASKKGAGKYFILYYLKQKLPEITQGPYYEGQLQP